jgi:hypothetical protein
MTVVLAVAELSALVGSNSADLTVAVSVIVLSGASVAFTFTTNVSVTVLPEARLDTVQVTVPLLDGAVQYPLLMKTLLKVVPVGTVSAIFTLLAASGPLLTTTIV